MAMDRFAVLAPLKHVVKIFLPSTNHDIPLGAEEIKKMQHTTLKMFSNLFGGATQQDVYGAWFSEELNTLIMEDITIIYSNCTQEQLETHGNDVIAYAEHVKSAYHQESIAIALDNTMYMV